MFNMGELVKGSPYILKTNLVNSSFVASFISFSFSNSFLCSLCSSEGLSVEAGQQRERHVIIQMQVFYLDVKIKLLNMCWSRCDGGVAAQTKCCRWFSVWRAELVPQWPLCWTAWDRAYASLIIKHCLDLKMKKRCIMLNKWSFPLEIFIIFDQIGFLYLFGGTNSLHAVH